MAIVAGAILAAGLPSRAQDGAPPTVISQVEPPRTETSDKYQRSAKKAGVDADARYVDKMSGSLFSDQAIREAQRARREIPIPTLDGALGIVLVFVLIIGLLLLWLKFGGTGTLLSGKPKDLKKKQEVPAGWQVTQQEQAMDGQALLDRLAAMADRREALARLLRHCLLSAGALSDTRFARSDTERDAFARLPENFKYHEALKTLLRDSELAHYGGRPVSEEMFAHNLELGRILIGTGGAHA